MRKPYLAVACLIGLTAAMAATDATDTKTSAPRSGAAATSTASAPTTSSRPKSQPLAAGEFFFTEGFEDANLAKRGWYDGETFRLVGDASAGKGCVEYEWTGEGNKVAGSVGVRHPVKPTSEIYIRYYLKLSKDFGWTGKNFHPHLTHVLTTENEAYAGPAATHLTLYVEPVDGRLRLAAQDIQNKDAKHGLTQGPLKGGYNGMLYDSKDKLFTDDKWHCIEAYFRLNTLDMKADKPNADGVARGWFDGKLVIDRTDIILRSTDFPDMKFNQFMIAPYFGPGLLPHAQKLWIDDLAVGAKRPEATTTTAPK